MDEITCCPVCFELYGENEDRLPRILPCHNTLCEKCIKELLRAGNSLRCPFNDNENHRAPKQEKSFPQNKYILGHLGGSKFETCKIHIREMSLFCKEVLCDKPICSLCLLEEHKTHEIVDVIEEQKELAEKVKNKIAASQLFLQSYSAKVKSFNDNLEEIFKVSEK